MQTRCGISLRRYLWDTNMYLVYPWYNLRQPKISLVYLEALVYSRDIPSICQNTKTYQRGQDSRCPPIKLSHLHCPHRPGLGIAPLIKVPRQPAFAAQVELLTHVSELAIRVHRPGEHPPLHPPQPLPAHLRQRLVALPELQVVS